MDVMNESFLGGRQLSVNIAKYGWANKRKQEKVKKQEETVAEKLPSDKADVAVAEIFHSRGHSR